MKKHHLRKANTDIILRKAIEDNDIAQVRFVLRFESDKINDQDENEMTALQWSCVYGRREIIGVLLDYGANMEIRDSKGWTSLHFAASGGFIDVVEFLLASYADVTATSNDGKSAIDVARGEGMVFLLATGFIKAGKEALLLRYFRDSTASLRSIDEADEESHVLSSSQSSELSREIWRASQHLLTKSSSVSIDSKSTRKASTSEYVIAKENLTEEDNNYLQRKNSTPIMNGLSSTLSPKKQRLNNFDSSFSPGVLKRLAVSETNLNKSQERDCNNNDQVAPCGTTIRKSNYYALDTNESDYIITGEAGNM